MIPLVPTKAPELEGQCYHRSRGKAEATTQPPESVKTNGWPDTCCTMTLRVCRRVDALLDLATHQAHEWSCPTTKGTNEVSNVPLERFYLVPPGQGGLQLTASQKLGPVPLGERAKSGYVTEVAEEQHVEGQEKGRTGG